MYAVRGYFKPESSFHTIKEWEDIANEFIELEGEGFDTRGGTIDYSPKLIQLVNKYFSYTIIMILILNGKIMDLILTYLQVLVLTNLVIQ